MMELVCTLAAEGGAPVWFEPVSVAKAVQVIGRERHPIPTTSPSGTWLSGSSRCHYGGTSPAVGLTDTSALVLLGTQPVSGVDARYYEVFAWLTLPDHVEFCRNPDKDQRPWCYTASGDPRWEYCEIAVSPPPPPSQGFRWGALPCWSEDP